MALAQVPAHNAHEILARVTEHTRLTAIIRAMAREIERLDEENRQLHAAVDMFRAVVRRYALKAS